MGGVQTDPASPRCNCQGKTLFLTIPNAFTYIISKSAARAKPFGTRIIAEISRILFQEYLYGDHLSLVITNKSYWSSCLGLILGLLTLEKSLFSSPLFSSRRNPGWFYFWMAAGLAWLNTALRPGGGGKTWESLLIFSPVAGKTCLSCCGWNISVYLWLHVGQQSIHTGLERWHYCPLPPKSDALLAKAPVNKGQSRPNGRK